MQPIDHVVIIFNPQSTKAKKGLVPKFKRELTGLAPYLKVSILKTDHSGHAEELAKAFAADATAAVLSASGDGGYNEVLNGIMSVRKAFHPALGVLPCGNANDHFHAVARGSTAKHIAEGKVRKLDMLRIDFTDEKGKACTRYAHSYIGFGITSYVRKRLDEKKINAFTEKIVAARSFVDAKPIRIRRLSEEHEVDSLFFTNIKVFAKFFKVKTSKPADGKYEVHVVHHTTQLHRAGALLRLNTKKSTVRSRSSEYAFTLLEKAPMQVDGEVIMVAKRSRVVVSLERGALRTII
jgi:diacylglycerol kinase family enzyme